MIEVRFLRGTESQGESLVADDGVITIDTDTGRIRVHDGVTAGGTPHATLAEALADNTPIGHAKLVATSLALGDYLPMDGSTYLKADYPDLEVLMPEASATEFTVPSYTSDDVNFEWRVKAL